MENAVKRIGVLTSGGDAPGMNAAIRAVVRTALNHKIEVMGIYEGYQGLIDNNMRFLNYKDVSNIINMGGTMLYSARCKEMMTEAGIETAVSNCAASGIDGLICLGGDGTFRGARELSRHGVRCIGIPVTIDNDISCTEYSIGFDTAVNTVLEFVDKVRDTCMSHARCSVVEVMGRNAGHIALEAGIATGAVAIDIPEVEFDYDRMIEKILRAKSQGRRQFIVIVAEGTGNTDKIRNMIVDKTDIETRIAVLAHVQRGGSPTAKDRVLASLMGNYAVDILLNGKMSRVVASQKREIIDLDIEEALNKPKVFDKRMLEVSEVISI